MTANHVIELTLAILKPDLVARARDLQVSRYNINSILPAPEVTNRHSLLVQ